MKIADPVGKYGIGYFFDLKPGGMQDNKRKEYTKMIDVFQQMVDRWPSGIVSRTEIGRFSGGVLTPKYMANLDAQGRGPARVVCGRKVAYPLRELVEWMRERSKA